MKKEKEKSLKKRSYKKQIYLLILCMGVGFAFLTSQLNIVGITGVKGGTWKVYFDNIEVDNESVNAETPVINNTKTRVDFQVMLSSPGDKYEFTVDAINEGEVNATIQSISMTPLDEATARYLTYEVTYDDDSEIAESDILEAGDTKKIKVLVEYKSNVNDEDILESNQTLNLSFGIDYIHATSKTPKRFIELVKNTAQLDNSIDFTKNSFYRNGNGLYKKYDTRNNANPIYYYRGDVDNNAIFAGYCWKVVRTTETGGTKLIYNGPQTYSYQETERLEEDDYNVITDQTASGQTSYVYSFNTSSKSWQSSSSASSSAYKTLEFSVTEAGDYILHANVTETVYNLTGYVMVDGEEVLTIDTSDGIYKWDTTLYNLTTSNVIKIYYTKSYLSGNYGTEKFSFSLDKGIDGVLGCDNSGPITQIGTANFNDNTNSLAYSGYMYGRPYLSTNATPSSSSKQYGSSFTYSNGQYILVDPQSSYDTTHHYTCGSSSSYCTDIYYTFSSSTYIKLSGGRSLEDAVTEMRLNTNDSAIKTAIDNWFYTNIVTTLSNSNIDYNDYIEDTIWCNDKTSNQIEVLGGAYPRAEGYYTNNGWNPNGGSTSSNLYYSGYGRLMTGQPSLTCSNKNDSFTVEESATGNGDLTYPVGLLTVDEVVLAGGQIVSNSKYYLNSNRIWWTMSPNMYSRYGTGNTSSSARTMKVKANGMIDASESGSYEEYTYDPSTGEYIPVPSGVRPSISLKSKVKVVADGDGTALNPYVFIVR